MTTTVQLQRAAARAAAAHSALEAAIRQARQEGKLSLRQIGDAAGVSYETVRRIAK